MIINDVMGDNWIQAIITTLQTNLDPNNIWFNDVTINFQYSLKNLLIKLGYYNALIDDKSFIQAAILNEINNYIFSKWKESFSLNYYLKKLDTYASTGLAITKTINRNYTLNNDNTNTLTSNNTNENTNLTGNSINNNNNQNTVNNTEISLNQALSLNQLALNKQTEVNSENQTNTSKVNENKSEIENEKELTDVDRPL